MFLKAMAYYPLYQIKEDESGGSCNLQAKCAQNFRLETLGGGGNRAFGTQE